MVNEADVGVAFDAGVGSVAVGGVGSVAVGGVVVADVDDGADVVDVAAVGADATDVVISTA